MRNRWWQLLLWTCACCGWAAMATAQTVYNPKIVQFDSPDHATLVGSYTVEFWMVGVDPATGKPVSTYTLDKSKVTTLGTTSPMYQANLADLTPVPAIPIGSTYVARLLAVGMDTSMISPRSDPSNPFASAVVPRSPLAVQLK